MVNTAAFQNIILPSSTPGDFLAIVYSTDGVTWQPLTVVNAANAGTGRFRLPITSWDALSHLQVAFVGLGTPDAPKVYLDAVGVEVQYMDAPEATTAITTSTAPATGDLGAAPAPIVGSTTASSTGPLSGPPSDVPPGEPTPPEPVPVVPQPQILQEVPVSTGDVFNQGAHQECSVDPFSKTMPRGTSATFSLELSSGLTLPSASGTASNYQHARYETRLGSLPPHVSGYITSGLASDDTSSTQIIHLSVGGAAARGSYSLLVIYRERQDDASLRSTGCQLNLIVP